MILSVLVAAAFAAADDVADDRYQAVTFAVAGFT
jgi:hypothetical protein